MVQGYGESDSNADFERRVYDVRRAFEYKEKCSAIDANDPIVVLGVNTSSANFVLPHTKDSSNRNAVSKLTRTF